MARSRPYPAPLRALLATAWLLVSATARTASAAPPPCAGDCNGDGSVAIDEVIHAVGIVLRGAALASCAAADGDADGVLTISDLARAVNSALAGCPELPAPDLVLFDRLNLQPEGVEYDAARRRFIVGSRTAGIIHTVDDDGTLSALVTDPGLDVTLGLHIDRASDRLIAAGAIGANVPAVGIYDLASGAPIHVVDLTSVVAPGAHLANDVVTDSAGNAYVTDTLTPAIYRIDPEGVPSLFSGRPQLARANGIELHDDRVLIVATLSGPSLLRVPLADPLAVTAVATEMSVAGDGIVFAADGDLVVVGAAANAGSVLRLRSDDDWQSAALVGTWDASAVGAGAATTAARRGADVYVIFAHLFDTARERYEIARAVFLAP